MLYAENGDRIVAADSATSLHPVCDVVWRECSECDVSCGSGTAATCAGGGASAGTCLSRADMRAPAAAREVHRVTFAEEHNRSVTRERSLNSLILIRPHCFQCFDAVGWAAGRASGL